MSLSSGELNLDLILYGLPDELPPERELLAEDMTLTLGGSSAIVAHTSRPLDAVWDLFRALAPTLLARSHSISFREAVLTSAKCGAQRSHRPGLLLPCSVRAGATC
jgi:hypothetical protein